MNDAVNRTLGRKMIRLGSTLATYLGAMVALGALLILLLILAFAGLTKVSENNEVVGEIADPSGELLVQVIEHNAMLSDLGYKILVRDPSRVFANSTEAAYIYAARRDDCSYGVKVRWLNERAVEIAFRSAEFVSAEETVSMGGRGITVRLAPNPPPNGLPCESDGYQSKMRKDDPPQN